MIPQALFGLGYQELIIILVIIVVLFGGAKLAGLGKASGKAIREFKEELSGSPSSDQDAAASPKPDTPDQ